MPKSAKPIECQYKPLTRAQIAEFDGKVVKKTFRVDGVNREYTGIISYNKRRTMPYKFDINYEDGDMETECYEFLKAKSGPYELIRNTKRQERSPTDSKNAYINKRLRGNTPSLSETSSVNMANPAESEITAESGIFKPRRSVSPKSPEDTQMESNDYSYAYQTLKYLSTINYDVNDQNEKNRFNSLQIGFKKDGIDHMEYILNDYEKNYGSSNILKRDLAAIKNIKKLRDYAQKCYSEDYTTAYEQLKNMLNVTFEDKRYLNDFLHLVYRAVIFDLLPNRERDDNVTAQELARINYLKDTYNNPNGVYKPRHPLATIRILEDFTKVLKLRNINVNVNDIQSGQYVKAYHIGSNVTTEKRWFNGRIFYVHEEIKESKATFKNEEAKKTEAFLYGIAYEDGYYEDAFFREMELNAISVPVDKVPNRYIRKNTQLEPRIYVLKFEYTDPSYLLQLTKAIKNEFNKAGYMSGIRPMLEKYHASHTTMAPFMFLFDAHLNFFNYELTKKNGTPFAEPFKAAMALFKHEKVVLKQFDYPDETKLIRYNTSLKEMTEDVREYNTSKSVILYRYDPTDRTSPGFAETTPMTTRDYVVQYLFNPASLMIRSKRPELPFVQAATETTRLFMRSDVSPLMDRPTGATLKYIVESNIPKCCCYLCGKKIAQAANKPNDPIYGQLDHLIPVVPAFVIGILDAPLNYAPTHKSCNISKNAGIPEGAPISPDFPDRDYTILAHHIQGLLTDDDSIRSDVSDAMDDEPSYEGGGTPRRSSERSMQRPSVSPPSTPEQSVARAFSRLSMSASPVSLSPIKAKLSLTPAREAVDYLFKEIRTILMTPPDKKLSFATILRLFLSHELFNFYNAILMINAPSSGAARSRSQSGGTPEVLNTRLTDFFKRFNPNNTGVNWTQNDRKAFIYARYSALYQFSLKYFEYQKTHGATKAESYIDFIIDRMAVVLTAKIDLSTGASRLAI